MRDGPTRGPLALGLVLGALSVWGVIQLSAVEYRLPQADRGMLRLSFRLSAEGEEICRPATEQELAELPVHMRTDEICERRAGGFDLSVTVGGDTLTSERLEGRGARGDRPVSLLQEWYLDPGFYEFAVEIAAVDDSQDASPLRLEQRVEVLPGRVVLVWIHPETGRLMLTS